MLQADEPEDFVLATGKTYSVRQFLDEAFQYAGMNADDYVEFDERYMRPTEVDLLLGDATKAKEKLGWEPKVGFKELVHMMVDADMENVRRDVEGVGKPTIARTVRRSD